MVRSLLLASVLCICTAAQAQSLPVRWVPASTSIGEQAAYDMSSGGPWTVFTAGQTIYRTRDRGTSWAVVPMPPDVEYVYALLVLDDGTVFAGSNRTVSRTADGGQTWTTVSLPTVFSSQSVRSIAETRVGTLLAGLRVSNGISTWGVVFRSDDGGLTWTASQSQPTFGPVVGIVEGETGALFAGHRLAGPEGAGGALMRSDDDGRTWTVVRQGSVDALALMVGGRFLIVTYTDVAYRLARASESGMAWEILGPVTRQLAGLLRAADGAVYLVDGVNGVQRTTDGGGTWQEVTEGLADRRVAAMTQDGDGYLYAGTPTGVFRSERPAVGSAPGLERVVTALESPRPNPAHGRVGLAFTLAESGDIDIALYDVLGRRVATVTQGAFGPGRHEVAWESSSLPPGVYSVVLRSRDGVWTRSMTFVQ